MAGPLPMVKKMTTAKTSEMPTQTALQIAASLNLMMCAPRWASRSMVSMIRTTAPKAAQAQSGTVMANPSWSSAGIGAIGADFSTVPTSVAADPWQSRAKNRPAFTADIRQMQTPLVMRSFRPERPAQQPGAGHGGLQLEAVGRIRRVPAGQFGDLLQPIGQGPHRQVQRPRAERGVAAGGEVRLQGDQQRLGATPGGGQRRQHRVHQLPHGGLVADQHPVEQQVRRVHHLLGAAESGAELQRLLRLLEGQPHTRRALLGLADAHPPGPDLGGPLQLHARGRLWAGGW